MWRSKAKLSQTWDRLQPCKHGMRRALWSAIRALSGLKRYGDTENELFAVIFQTCWCKSQVCSICARLMPGCSLNWCAYCWYDEKGDTGLGSQLVTVPKLWLKQNWGIISMFLYSVKTCVIFLQNRHFSLGFESLDLNFWGRFASKISEVVKGDDFLTIFLFRSKVRNFGHKINKAPLFRNRKNRDISSSMASQILMGIYLNISGPHFEKLSEKCLYMRTQRNLRSAA